VNDRTIRATIAAGARTIEDITAACGAGGRCGGCWPVLRELLDDLTPASERPVGAGAASTA
jgi:bacterioferritin-associated ferredoxin